MAEMVERVALILARQDAVDMATGLGDEEPNWHGLARAAILALREPTEAMLAAIPAGAAPEQRELAREHWRAMIDAALE